VVNRVGTRPSPIFLAILAAAILGGVLCGVSEDGSGLATFGTVLLVLGGWGVSLCLHEFGHAIVAYKGGDFSVRHKGYLTLDPRRYTDPVSSLLLPLLFLLIGGIPLPGGAVWINHHALRSRKVESLTSLAGPLSNLVLGVLLALITQAFWPGFSALISPLGAALSCLALFQVLAFIINILPIPGLDGWGAIEPFLSPEARRLGAQVRPWAPLVLFALLIGVGAVGQALYGLTSYVFDAVGGNYDAGQIGLSTFLFWRR
jgi:Zn-dependent protease